MTARYRCPYCGEGSNGALKVRKHIAKDHRNAVLSDLRVIEAYGTRKTLDPPRKAAKPHPPLNPVGCLDQQHGTAFRCPTCAYPRRLNPGVSGEGDE